MSTGSRVGARHLHTLLGQWETTGSIHGALADRLQLLIIDGRLSVGARLPSERELAGELGRSRATVVAAYSLLKQRGYLRSRQGSGTIASLPRRVDQRGVVDLAHAVPPPVEGLADIARQAMGQLERAIAGPGFDMYGDEVLRARIAERYRHRGLPTTPDQVLVTVGGQHAIGLVARALGRRGERFLAESPSYPHAYEAIRLSGADVVTTPVLRDGWDIRHLVSTLERYRPTAAYLVPDFHNPTGASMPAEARTETARAARKVGTTLVIDETTADLDIDRGWDDGPFAQHAEVAGAEVVTIGSLSKSLWGGLRIGWIRAEPAFLTRIARLRPAHDLGTPRLEQLVACELVPRMDELLSVRRTQLRTGRDELRSQLHRALPSWDAPPAAGGLSLWVGLGSPLSSSLSLLCQAQGVAVSAGPRFTLDGSQERFLRLPYTLPRDEMTRGVSVLADAWLSLVGPTGERDLIDQQSVV